MEIDQSNRGYPSARKYPSALFVDQIQAVLAEALRVPPDMVTPDLTLGDLPQWDSMGHMDLMMLLEARYGVEITAETIGALTSIAAICAYLQENGHI